MSFDALAWAGRCQPGSATRKLLLIALAECHSKEHDKCCPSIAWLSEWTGMNRKTIIAGLADLEKLGFISDTGRRVGKTGQIAAWKLHLESVPKTEQSQKRNSSDFAIKESQNWDTEPGREPGINNNPPTPLNTSERQKRLCKPKASETDFLIWWKAYPRKVGKQAALKAWRSAIKRGATVEQLLKAAKRYAANPPDDPRFIPHPTTWLNQGRYEDEPQMVEEEWRPPW